MKITTFPSGSTVVKSRVFHGVSAGPSTRPPPWLRARAASASSSSSTAAKLSVSPEPVVTGPGAARTSRSWNCHRRKWTNTGPSGPGMAKRLMKPSPSVYQDVVRAMSATRRVANIGIP